MNNGNTKAEWAPPAVEILDIDRDTAISVMHLSEDELTGWR